ncbi:5044_t:CDS:2, partial [Diversispora eburnea]
MSTLHSDSDTRTRSISTTSYRGAVHETDELKKFRYYWWKTGIMHSKAKWDEATLPYELASDVSYDAYVEQTDKHNIHGWWEWENGTVRVVEFPSGFLESCVGAIVQEIYDTTRNVKGTYADILSLGATTTRSHEFAKEAHASFRPNQKPHVNAGGSDGETRPWPNIVVEGAHSQSVAYLLSKVENYWLKPGRAHDAIAIKIEPTTPLSVMTAWHYCINNRTNIGALSPLI